MSVSVTIRDTVLYRTAYRLLLVNPAYLSYNVFVCIADIVCIVRHLPASLCPISLARYRAMHHLLFLPGLSAAVPNYWYLFPLFTNFQPSVIKERVCIKKVAAILRFLLLNGKKRTAVSQCNRSLSTPISHRALPGRQNTFWRRGRLREKSRTGCKCASTLTPRYIYGYEGDCMTAVFPCLVWHLPAYPSILLAQFRSVHRYVLEISCIFYHTSSADASVFA